MNLRPLGYEPRGCLSQASHGVPYFASDLGVRVPDVTRRPMLSVVFRCVRDALWDAAFVPVAGLWAQ